MKHSGDIARCRDCKFFWNTGDVPHGVCKCPKCGKARLVEIMGSCRCNHFEICEGQQT